MIDIDPGTFASKSQQKHHIPNPTGTALGVLSTMVSLSISPDFPKNHPGVVGVAALQSSHRSSSWTTAAARHAAAAAAATKNQRRDATTTVPWVVEGAGAAKMKYNRILNEYLMDL